MKKHILLLSLIATIAQGAEPEANNLIEALELAAMLPQVTPKDQLKKILSVNAQGSVVFPNDKYQEIHNLLENSENKQIIGFKSPHGKNYEFSIAQLKRLLRETREQNQFTTKEEGDRDEIETAFAKKMFELKHQAEQEFNIKDEATKRQQIAKNIAKEHANLLAKSKKDRAAEADKIKAAEQEKEEKSTDLLDERANVEKEMLREHAQFLAEQKQKSAQINFPKTTNTVQTIITELSNIQDFEQDESKFANFSQTFITFTEITKQITTLQTCISGLNALVSETIKKSELDSQDRLDKLKTDLTTKQNELKDTESTVPTNKDTKDQKAKRIKDLSIDINNLNQEILLDAQKTEQELQKAITAITQGNADHITFTTILPNLYALLCNGFVLDRPILGLGKSKIYLQLKPNLAELNKIAFKHTHTPIKDLPDTTLDYIKTALSLILLEYQHLFPLDTKFSFTLGTELFPLITTKWAFYTAHAGLENHEKNPLFTKYFKATENEVLKKIQKSMDLATNAITRYNLSSKNANDKKTAKTDILNLLTNANKTLFAKIVDTTTSPAEGEAATAASFYFKLQNQFEMIYPLEESPEADDANRYLAPEIEETLAAVAIIWLELIKAEIITENEEIELDSPMLEDSKLPLQPADWANYTAHAGYDNMTSKNRPYFETAPKIKTAWSFKYMWNAVRSTPSYITNTLRKWAKKLKPAQQPIRASDL